MNKFKNLILILCIAILFVLALVFYKTYNKNSVSNQQVLPVFANDVKPDSFSDGLNNPDSVTTYPLDEYGVGVSQKSIYYVDINDDKMPDRITKTFIETGNAHSYYEYKIELNKDGKYLDITPKNLRTTNGDTCDLQQIQFVFKPSFRVIMIYRELGDTWMQPTNARKQTFTLSGNELQSGTIQNLPIICDVKELF